MVTHSRCARFGYQARPGALASLVVPNRCSCRDDFPDRVRVSWGDPFPLVHHDNGDLSISPWFDRLLAVAGCGAFATIFLALFGRGVKRLLLAVAGLLMLFLTYGALLSMESDQ